MSDDVPKRPWPLSMDYVPLAFRFRCTKCGEPIVLLAPHTCPYREKEEEEKKP